MTWEYNEIKPGDAVRVNMGIYYHYGICTAEDRIVQFGYPQINPNPDEVEVCATDIKTFLSGKFAEVLVLNKKEIKQANNVKTIIEKAENSIGEKGYNILHNNCEHFVNRCVFNKNKSNQVLDVEKQMFNLINPKEIYIAPVEMFFNNNSLPKYAQQELKSISHDGLRSQKIASYGLLKYAVEKLFKIQEDFKSYKKSKNGKPLNKNYCLSISHTNNLVAVGISKCNLGIDLENVNQKQNIERIKNAILACGEKFSNQNIEEVYSVWTKKEAIFKFNGDKVFNPKQVNFNTIPTKTIDFEFDGLKYVLSVASEDIKNVNIIKLF